MVDQVREVTWQKQWRGGPWKNPTPKACAQHLHAVLCVDDQWEFRPQPVPGGHRSHLWETCQYGEAQLPVSPLPSSRLAWKSGAPLNL